jgi:hypothetical protein
MCLSTLFKHHLNSRRNTKAAHREAKLETNDHQRLNENLLRIALKRHTSVNSLTDRDPSKVVREKKMAWEEKMGRS